MSPTWDPRLVLGLQQGEQSEWQCLGTVVSTDGDTARQCQRQVHHAEPAKLQSLFTDMSNQMPDQVDHNMLLHLARACLCVESPDHHRGNQEANVIYRWTELMAREAETLRAQDHDKAKVEASPLDRLPTPKAFTSPLNDEQHVLDSEAAVSLPRSTALRSAAPPFILPSLQNATSPTSIRDRRASRITSNDSPTSTLTIIPPVAFPSTSGSSLPPSPPNSATINIPTPPETTFEELPPPPTSTTIRTNDSSASTHRESSLSIGEEAPATHTSNLSNLIHKQLDENTRFLKEIQAQQAIILQQTVDLRVELSQIRLLCKDLVTTPAKAVFTDAD